MWSLLFLFFTVAWGAEQVLPPNCQLVLPPFPLTYQGLLTPYQLQTIDANMPCSMKTFPAFAEAVILDLDTNSLSVYHPLIVDFGTAPLVQPVAFNMNPNSMVAIHFGSNGMAIKLFPPLSVQQANCVYGIGGTTTMDEFGQFAHCNAVAFFQQIQALLQKGASLNPPPPPLGVASDGEPCPTTRDFFLVDMDPSDNVVTTYLLDPVTGRTAQNIAATQQTNPQTVVIKNGSDNLLLATLDKIMGCTPYQVPNLVDLANPVNRKISSMALDEIHAALRQEGVYAYLPKGDPMARIQMFPNLLKLNLYRQGVFQPMVNDLGMADTALFCMHMTEIQLRRVQKNKGLFMNQPSPDAAISPHLFGFLANRFFGSYNGLNCPILLDLPNPVMLMMTGGLVTDAVFAAVPPFPAVVGDPYLLSWDEYPAFTPSPTVTPTVLPSVTPSISPSAMPGNGTPTVTPTPAINNVDGTPGKQILTIVLCSVSAALVVAGCVLYYCRRMAADPRPDVQVAGVYEEKNVVKERLLPVGSIPPRTPRSQPPTIHVRS